MNQTKIIVLQLKQIIKSVILFVLGIILMVILIFIFIPKNKPDENALYNPGSYYSYIILHGKPVNVEVTVNKNKILSIELDGITENQEVFYPLFKPTMQSLSRQILEYQSADLPTTIDYTETGKILLSAVNNALTQAKLDNI